MKKNLLFALVALCALVGCHGQSDDPTTDQPNKIIEGPIELRCNRDIIIPNGSDSANLQVLVTDANGVVHDVTSGAEFFLTGESEALASSVFTTTTAADYEIYAIYGMSVSDKVQVSAIDGITELPEDKGGGEFAHHVLLLQHTGTGCGACPYVISMLKSLSEDADYTSKYYHVASHSFNEDDKAYSAAARNISAFKGVRYYPDITYNHNPSYFYALEPNDLASVKSRIDELHSPYAAVGVTATVTHKDGKLYVNSEIRCEVNNEYRIAYWVLEDGIYSKQYNATAAWQNTHNNALRKMYGETNSIPSQVYGSSVGVLSAGASARRIVAIDCDSKWVLENCKVAVVVYSTYGDDYEMENIIVCPVGGSVAYEYN